MPTPKLPKIKKKFNPKDPNPCEGCSNCCEYVSLEIDRPDSFTQLDEIYWYLLHKDVWVYIDHDNDWFIQFNTPCEKLVDRRCNAYFQRPQLCRDYEAENCVRYGDGPPEKFLFQNEVDLFRYIYKKRPKTYAKAKKRYAFTAAIEKEIKKGLKVKK